MYIYGMYIHRMKRISYSRMHLLLFATKDNNQSEVQVEKSLLFRRPPRKQH